MVLVIVKRDGLLELAIIRGEGLHEAYPRIDDRRTTGRVDIMLDRTSGNPHIRITCERHSDPAPVPEGQVNVDSTQNRIHYRWRWWIESSVDQDPPVTLAQGTEHRDSEEGAICTALLWLQQHDLLP